MYDGFKHRAIILMCRTVELVLCGLTKHVCRDLRLDSLQNKDSKNSETPKVESVRGPYQNTQDLIFIRFADFCTPTDQSQMLDTSSHQDEKRDY